VGSCVVTKGALIRLEPRHNQRAEASNSSQNSLNYSWSASEGSVDGTGPEVRWNSSDRRPGTHHPQQKWWSWKRDSTFTLFTSSRQRSLAVSSRQCISTFPSISDRS
jgi:hypothetical protein